ncbi:hypothetical protein F4808DRAFT_254042 [Astrocystis sublimbata]|nr:hypothetical protein F4808DRAFT_254042 [Astrocystis sublimbata]
MPSYPGFGLSLRHLPQASGDIYPTGHHEECLVERPLFLQVREVAMMHLMDRLTDKVDWHKKVFNNDIVARWRTEALAYPDDVLWKLAAVAGTEYFKGQGSVKGIMTGNMFDYCIQELQAKAKYFAATGICPTLDAAIASVAKSDELVRPELAEVLRQAFARLKKDQSGAPDWHPKTDDKVLNLVHPSLYPLVYKVTKVLQDEVVGVADAIDRWAGKGTIIRNDGAEDDEPDYVPADLWSEEYQWLPSNVTLHDDGSAKFTSYINNLHPTKYPEIYSALEKLVQNALPLWDQCLWTQSEYEEKTRPGRLASRFSLPDDMSDENEANWSPSSWEALRPAIPDPAEATMTKKQLWEAESELQEKWEEMRQAVLPEPNPFEKVDYTPRNRLVEKFRDTGLQIIVKMVSIELTPEKPSYPAGSWHVEGQLNEHICGTALYYLDSENVTTSNLSFRMQTNSTLNEEPPWENIGQDQYTWVELVHGTALGGWQGACLQYFGNVETPQGRLLAFPNVFQHAVSPFELVDKTKPGYRRFIALWLVDPHIRVISTANVPPQQQDWWMESVFGRTLEAQQAALAKLPAELVRLLEEKGLVGKTPLVEMRGKLPPELELAVRAYLEGEEEGESTFIMTAEEARAHRLKLMEQRTALEKRVNQELNQRSYNFCEH